MSFRPYPAYQPAAGDFLQTLPQGWSEKPLWATCTCNDEVLSETTDPEAIISYIEISDVSLVEGIRAAAEMSFAAAPSRARRKVREGDILVSTVRTYLRAIAGVTAEHAGAIASTGFAVLRPTAVDGGFLQYAVQPEEFVGGIISRSTGVSYPAINAGDLVKLKVSIPDRSTQKVIASFLDLETAKLDGLIVEQGRLLTLMAEQRRAAVARLITKGIDVHAPMRDSGVAWMCEVPSHWRVVALKRLVSEMCDGPFGSGLKSDHYTSQGARVVRLQNIRAGWFDDRDASFIDEAYFKTKLSGHDVRAGDVLVAGLGDERNLVGRACVAPADLGPALVKADCFRLRLNTEAALPSFLAAQLSSGASHDAGMMANGSTRSRISLSVTATRPVAVPPTLAEQSEIMSRVQEFTTSFDSLASEAHRSIALLRERRAALISAAVTGRIDVRGAVPASQDELVAA